MKPTVRPVQVSEGISTFVLLALLLLSVTGSVVAADWTDGLGTLSWSAFAGLMFGFLAARSRLSGWLTHPVMLGLALPVTIFFVSGLLSRTLTLQERAWVLTERIAAWARKVLSGGTSVDTLIFVVQLVFLMWVIAYVAAWFVYRRHQAWGAIVPAGVALTFNLFYAAPQTGLYFGLFVASALLLIVRLNLHAMERAWRTEAVGYSSDISFDFLGYGIVFSLIVILLAWIVPPTAPGPAWLTLLDPLQAPWQNVEEQFNRVFGALRGVARPSPTSYYGTTLSMGGPVKLGNRPVMDVQTNYGRYWRATVYDRYIGIGWLNTQLDTLALNPNDARLVTRTGGLRVEVTQTVKLHLPDQNMIFAAAQPLRFNLPTEIRYAHPPPDDPEAPTMEVALVRARKTLRDGETYTVVSAINAADEKSLRADSVQYSRWISATYLALPDDLPARVRTLARAITAKHTNAYDQAAAIENYLRTNIRYNELVNAPPPGRDGVDYLLFERPEGYCNYYASAMAVLARAVGIPARVASGYALGDYKDGAFHVIEANAHSWTELYFPSYGWIEFEPTAAQPSIERPRYRENEGQPNFDENAEARRRRERGELDDEGEVGPAPNAGLGTRGFGLPTWQTLALFASGLGGLIAIGVTSGVVVMRARRAARLAPAARVYEAMLGRARWLGVREQISATPLERAQALSDAMPNARAATERIAELYTRERYAAQSLDANERAALNAAWNAVRAQWRTTLIANQIERVRAPFRAMRARLEKSPVRATQDQSNG